MIASSQASRYVPADSHGGAFRAGQPRIIVIHSIECPLGGGWASDLAVNWMQHADVSVHYIVDPGQVVQCLDEALIGWGAGTVNSAAIHIEQSGYARYSRAEWTTADGLAQIRRVGALVADIAARHGIPVRWLTDAQLRAAWQGDGPGGMATHSDCTRVIGGTTHTDPGDGYPRDLLLTAATGSHAEAPIPTPTPPEEDDMPYSEDQLRAIVRDEVTKAIAADNAVQYPVVDATTTPNTYTLTKTGMLQRAVRVGGLAAAQVVYTPAQIAGAVKTVLPVAGTGATADQIATAVIQHLGEALS